MKILHVMKNEKFTKSVVMFYDRYFDLVEHEVLYLNYSKDSIVSTSTKIKQKEIFMNNTLQSRIKIVQELLKNQYDYIVLHSLLFDIFVKLALIFTPNTLNKVVWIEWGADLYSWKIKASNIVSYIKNFIEYRLRLNIKNIVCIFPPDIEYFNKRFSKHNQKIYYAKYTGYPIDNEFLNYDKRAVLDIVVKNNEPIYIQIGHNALETLNHIRVLKNLEKFKNENIILFLPLSYGGKKMYVDEVEKYAKKAFPGKVIVLRDFMPEKEYFNLMKKISIAIFDTERQCGLGNIHRLNFRNVKLFLSKDGVMYDYFQSRGVPVEKCEDIKEMTFADFTKTCENKNKDEFKRYIQELSDINLSVNQWRNIFDSLRTELHAK